MNESHSIALLGTDDSIIPRFMNYLLWKYIERAMLFRLPNGDFQVGHCCQEHHGRICWNHRPESQQIWTHPSIQLQVLEKSNFPKKKLSSYDISEASTCVCTSCTSTPSPFTGIGQTFHSFNHTVESPWLEKSYLLAPTKSTGSLWVKITRAPFIKTNRNPQHIFVLFIRLSRLECELGLREGHLCFTIQKGAFHDFGQELSVVSEMTHFSITSDWCQRSFDLNSSVLCVVHRTTTLEAPDLWCHETRTNLGCFFKWVLFLFCFCQLVHFFTTNKKNKRLLPCNFLPLPTNSRSFCAWFWVCSSTTCGGKALDSSDSSGRNSWSFQRCLAVVFKGRVLWNV